MAYVGRHRAREEGKQKEEESVCGVCKEQLSPQRHSQVCVCLHHAYLPYMSQSHSQLGDREFATQRMN
jgi:hypothetical protein